MLTPDDRKRFEEAADHVSRGCEITDQLCSFCELAASVLRWLAGAPVVAGCVFDGGTQESGVLKCLHSTGALQHPTLLRADGRCGNGLDVDAHVGLVPVPEKWGDK